MNKTGRILTRLVRAYNPRANRSISELPVAGRRVPCRFLGLLGEELGSGSASIEKRWIFGPGIVCDFDEDGTSLESQVRQKRRRALSRWKGSC